MKKVKEMFAALKAKREEKRRQQREETIRSNQEMVERQIDFSGFVSL